jgi:hypothetical protein
VANGHVAGCELQERHQLSYEVHRAIGITQKSAWFMDHRIRFALGMTPGNRLSGQIEADETFIGGKAQNMYKDKRAEKITGTGGKDKTAVMGILERGSKVTGSKVRVKVVDNTKKKSLQSEVREHVLAGVRSVHRCPEVLRGPERISA